MKNKFKLALLGLTLFGGMALNNAKMPIRATLAEEPIVEPIEEETTPKGTITIEKNKLGTIKVDLEGLEGEVGEIVTLEVTPKIFYIAEYVAVNGVNLIEDESISGKYTFALVEGENKISAKFVYDVETYGEEYRKIANMEGKTWEDIFSVETVVTIVKWLLDGGILVALIRYYVKDKKLAKNLGDTVQSTVNNIIPQTTKDTVVKTVEDVITPIFNQIIADNVETKKALATFSKCMALAQKGDEQSKALIIDELTGLKIGDMNAIENIKQYIENLIAEHDKTYKETLEAINRIGESNKQIIEDNKVEEQVKKEKSVVIDNGTQI